MSLSLYSRPAAHTSAAVCSLVLRQFLEGSAVMQIAASNGGSGNYRVCRHTVGVAIAASRFSVARTEAQLLVQSSSGSSFGCCVQLSAFPTLEDSTLLQAAASTLILVHIGWRWKSLELPSYSGCRFCCSLLSSFTMRGVRSCTVLLRRTHRLLRAAK